MFKVCSLLSPHQDTPLHVAVAGEGAYTNSVQYLIDKGAEINIKDKRGVSEWDCNGDLSLSTQVPDKGSGICLYN